MERLFSFKDTSHNTITFEEDIEVMKNKLRSIIPDLGKKDSKSLVISDMDEVIVNITKKWAELALKDGLVKDSSKVEIKSIINRPCYDILEFLGIPREKGMELYDTPTFYDDLTPTRFGFGLAIALRDSMIDLVILSHTTPNNLESKWRFCQKFFPKAEFIPVSTASPKSAMINLKEMNHYGTLCEDSPTVLKDLVFRTNSIGKEFLVPKYGYNQLENFDKEMLEAMLENKVQLKYYENVL